MRADFRLVCPSCRSQTVDMNEDDSDDNATYYHGHCEGCHRGFYAEVDNEGDTMLCECGDKE